MNKKEKSKILEMMGGIQCPNNFKCVDSGFEILCKTHDIGLDHYLECLEPENNNCKFAVAYGNGYFCHCPLRVYLTKNLRK